MVEQVLYESGLPRTRGANAEELDTLSKSKIRGLVTRLQFGNVVSCHFLFSLLFTILTHSYNSGGLLLLFLLLPEALAQTQMK